MAELESLVITYVTCTRKNYAKDVACPWCLFCKFVFLRNEDDVIH